MNALVHQIAAPLKHFHTDPDCARLLRKLESASPVQVQEAVTELLKVIPRARLHMKDKSKVCFDAKQQVEQKLLAEKGGLLQQENKVTAARKEIAKIASVASALLNLQLPSSPLSSKAQSVARNLIIPPHSASARQCFIAVQHEVFEQSHQNAERILRDTHHECTRIVDGLHQALQFNLVPGLPQVRHRKAAFDAIETLVTTDMFELARQYGLGTRLPAMILPPGLLAIATNNSILFPLMLTGGIAGLRSLKRSKVAAVRREIPAAVTKQMQAVNAGAHSDLRIFQTELDQELTKSWHNHCAGRFGQISKSLKDIQASRAELEDQVKESNALLDQANQAAHTLFLHIAIDPTQKRSVPYV